ncbi:MAG: AgmX/PglI C-terminal domain-containing protein [Myxococcaceae bacterium]
MKRLIVLTALVAASAAPAQGSDPGKSQGSSAVMKGLIRDATDTGRGGLDPNVKPPPDVTKMPFSQESIKAVIAYHQPQIQACYEETLASREKVMEGKLATRFTITGEGMVKDAKIEKKGTTLKEPKLHECVVAVLSTMTFPKPVDGRDHPIEFPFNLKAIQ